MELPSQRWRALAAAGAGTFVEFFDYSSYVYLATTLTAVFFPKSTGATGLIQTFGVFAASFAMRPIGALFWGHFGDQIGRKRTLALTIIGIGLATLAIGLLPGYESIGVCAPLLLVVIRLFQSFCTAGEYSGAAILVGEFAPPLKRGRFVSIVPISCALGFLMASGLASWLRGSLADKQILAWGWRVPFLVGGVLTVFGWYLRRLLAESPEFEKVVAQKAVRQAPVYALLRTHKVEVVRLLCVMAVNAAGYYLVLGYMTTYLEVEARLSAYQAGIVTTAALVVYLPLLYLVAAVSDRIGRRYVLLGSSILFLLLSYPAFGAIQIGSVLSALLIQLLLVAIFALNDGSFATYFVESFPAEIRFSGFALPFNIGVALFGGTTPLLATWLIQQTGNRMMPALTMTAIAALSLPALILAPETATRKGESQGSASLRL
jgi:MFS transporter, MHS family, proline/betaine transporter